NDGFRSRRRFLSRAGRGVLGLGVLAGSMAGCDPGEFMDYLLLEEEDKVTDRFYESISGHCRRPVIPEATSDQFSFLWTSDIHVTRDKPHYIDLLGKYADECDAAFILHSGDCVDRGKEDEYIKLVDLLDYHSPVPMITALGNHDVYNDGWPRYKKYIGPSVFKFRYARCEFIFIDTAAGTMGRDQMDWLESKLKHSPKPLRFVLSHYPIYDGSFQTPASMGNTEERMKLIYLFDEYDVNYFLCGHKHTGAHYKIRGCKHLIGGAGCPYKMIIEDRPHLYRFDIEGTGIGKKKVYFEDLEGYYT
ncbi:MAG: metallophosphoesterase, partial [bacterium]